MIAGLSLIASIFGAVFSNGATLPLILAAIFGVSATVAVGALAIVDAYACRGPSRRSPPMRGVMPESFRLLAEERYEISSPLVWRKERNDDLP
jgi:hypothetical protein